MSLKFQLTALILIISATSFSRGRNNYSNYKNLEKWTSHYPYLTLKSAGNELKTGKFSGAAMPVPGRPYIYHWQKSLSVRLFSFGFDAEKKYSENKAAGFGISWWYESGFLLNNPTALRTSASVKDGFKETKVRDFSPWIVEIAKVSIYNNFYFTPCTSLSTGVYGSYAGIDGDEDGSFGGGLSAGLIFRFVTGFKHFRIGTGNQAGRMFFKCAGKRNHFNTVCWTPVILSYYI
ncbi:MAG: hypothetical protein K8R53_06800 [Bacteroidales bacterium]|nr:hypothetical protein [Bacteroidales bacterium]